MMMIASWVAQVVAALILLQTLFFKFSGAPESVAIFTTLGVEPWGRIASGIVELIVAAGLLYPKTAGYAGVLGAIVMAGAIAAHITRLGIIGDDGGLLFSLAVLTFICCGVVALIRFFPTSLPQK